MIVEQAWTPAQFAMPLGVKDVELALATAREVGMHASQRGDDPQAPSASNRKPVAAEQDWAALAGKLAADAGL